MAFVKVPNEYFQKSKLEYSDWRWAFFRELIQNSYDAGASTIDFTLTSLTQPGAAHHRLKVTCVDNGKGMTKDILENVLLCLGGSYKEGSSIGGFGYAKSILFFAHEYYVINTGNWLVNGAGGEYRIDSSDRTVHGTHIEVVLAADISSMYEILKRYCSFISVPRNLRITIGGVVVPTTFSDFRFANVTKLGKLLFNETTERSSELVVAVRGLPMFVHTTYTQNNLAIGYSGLLELQGESYDLLTANRDALKGEYARQLDGILRSMIDGRAVLKQGRIVNLMLNFDAANLNSALQVGKNTLVNIFKSTTIIPGESRQEDNLDPIRNDYYPTNFSLRICNYGSKYVENSDKVTLKEVISLMKKTAVKRIAWEWKRCVYTILASGFYNTSFYLHGKQRDPKAESVNSLLEGDFFLNGRKIIAGFIISKDLEGLNACQSDGNILILVNPSFFIRKDYDYHVADLMDVAQHECAHIRASGHGEEFCNVEIEARRVWRRVYNETHLVEVKKLRKPKETTKRTPLRKKRTL